MTQTKKSVDKEEHKLERDADKEERRVDKEERKREREADIATRAADTEKLMQVIVTGSNLCVIYIETCLLFGISYILCA